MIPNYSEDRKAELNICGLYLCKLYFNIFDKGYPGVKIAIPKDVSM